MEQLYRQVILDQILFIKTTMFDLVQYITPNKITLNITINQE